MSASQRRGDGRGDPLFRQPAWESMGFVLWHAAMRWQRELADALRPLGLTYAQFTLLGSTLWLPEVEDIKFPNQKELSDHTGISPMMTSQVLRKLEGMGLVARAPDADDTRSRRVAITPAGRALAIKALRVVDRADDSFFSVVNDQAELIDELRRIAGRNAEGQPLE